MRGVFTTTVGLMLLGPSVLGAEPAPSKRVLLLLPFDTWRPVAQEELILGVEKVCGIPIRDLPPFRSSFSGRRPWIARNLKVSPLRRPRLKHEGQPVSAIGVLGLEGLNVAKELRSRLWPDASIVFQMARGTTQIISRRRGERPACRSSRDRRRRYGLRLELHA